MSPLFITLIKINQKFLHRRPLGAPRPLPRPLPLPLPLPRPKATIKKEIVIKLKFWQI